MRNKYVDLCDMVKLVEDEDLSEKYVRYICGMDGEKQYRHREIADISALLDSLAADERDGNLTCDFLYGYCIPQLNKEFDLLKFSEYECVNIELKSQMIAEERIRTQLLQNAHFLNMLSKRLYLFTYVSAEDALFRLADDGRLERCDFNILHDILAGMSAVRIDPDEIFTPKNILVSPLNSPEKFLEGKYLLTEHQLNIKSQIISAIGGGTAANYAITGGPGTGKTLLAYDIAKTLSEDHKVAIVHSGILCEGHDILRDNMQNVYIFSAKSLRGGHVHDTLADADVIIVDEAHRIYPLTLDNLIAFCKNSGKYCIYSYDSSQILSKSEEARNNSQKIEALCENTKYKLTNKIRTNKELALFITCLFDLSKFCDNYSFEHVNIIYEPDLETAYDRAFDMRANSDYAYIGYTPSTVYDNLDDQKTDVNTHKVIGQEFEKVCMILNKYFYYKDGMLRCHEHPNPDYIFTKLLYQGLTRVRSELTLIVTEDDLLENILKLFPPRTNG